MPAFAAHTSGNHESIGNVDYRVELGIVLDFFLDPSAQIPPEPVDPLGQSLQLGVVQLEDKLRLRGPILRGPKLKLKTLVLKIVFDKLPAKKDAS